MARRLLLIVTLALSSVTCAATQKTTIPTPDATPSIEQQIDIYQKQRDANLEQCKAADNQLLGAINALKRYVPTPTP